MPPDPDAAGVALREVLQRFFAAVQGGWIHEEPDAFAAVTGVPMPTVNGVWVDARSPRPELVGVLLDEVAATGLPHCVQARPAAAAHLEPVLRERGLTAVDSVPLMVLDGPVDPGGEPTHLAIRELDPSEALLHAELVAGRFEAPVEPLAQLITPAVLATSGLRCYVGEVHGRPVTTGLGLTVGSFVFVGDIATPREHRRRGYGAAVTARAVADGLAAGATWSILQTSPAGFDVYRRLGFRTVEDWPCWIS